MRRIYVTIAFDRNVSEAGGQYQEIFWFRPDLNGLMSVRHPWALTMHQKAALFREKEEALHSELGNAEDVATYGGKVRSHYLKVFGGLPPRPENIDYKVVRELESDGVQIEVFHFESLPGFLVPGLIFHSTKAQQGPGVFIACGHMGDCKAANQYQRLASNYHATASQW